MLVEGEEGARGKEWDGGRVEDRKQEEWRRGKESKANGRGKK